MTEHLDIEDLLTVAREATGAEPRVGDWGLLESALARPRATVFGQDAYPDLHTKAAALLQSLACNHGFIDGNKRTAWTACRTLLAINDEWVSAHEDERFEFVMQVATGLLSNIDKMAERLRNWSYTSEL